MKYGRYEIVRELGHGAMSVVYLARDPSIGRMVAVKVLRRDWVEDGDTANRLLREAKVIGRLSHPHIVNVYDVGVESGNVYVAEEYLEETLSHVTEQKRLDVKDVVQAGVQLAEALDYAHGKGVVHRDVKPANIMIGDGQVKLADFGIARLEDGSATLHTQAAAMGTPAYMSPEQVQGGNVDRRSDLYSLGVVLYELSTGIRPFGGKGKTLATVFNEIINATPKAPDAVAAPVPKELSAAIMKAIDKDPERRFQTGREMAEALQRCLAAPPPRQPTARPYAVSLLVAMLMASGGYGIYKVVPIHARPKPTEPAAVTAKPAPLPKVEVSVKTADSGRSSAAPKAPKAESVTAIPAGNLAGSPTPPRAATAAAPARAPARTAKASSAAKALPVATERALARPGPLSAKAPPPIAAVSTESGADPIPVLTLPKFAFLKVRSVPEGSRVYIDGTFKGRAPLSIKLKLGEYKVRLSHPGYEDTESKVTLSKMTDYPLRRELKPAGI